jgi:hypothetical protein
VHHGPSLFGPVGGPHLNSHLGGTVLIWRPRSGRAGCPSKTRRRAHAPRTIKGSPAALHSAGPPSATTRRAYGRRGLGGPVPMPTASDTVSGWVRRPGYQFGVQAPIPVSDPRALLQALGCAAPYRDTLCSTSSSRRLSIIFAAILLHPLNSC